MSTNNDFSTANKFYWIKDLNFDYNKVYGLYPICMFRTVTMTYILLSKNLLMLLAS